LLKPGPLIKIDIRLDSFKNVVKFTRTDWLNQIGVIGGIYGFLATIIMTVVGHFVDIDYYATFIKKLFLEE